jgi:hypothetical protein
VASAAVGGCLVVALTAIAVTHAMAPPPHPARPSVIRADADALLPSTTATDWVTYGDHLVEATVTSEQALPASDEEIAASEGFIPRVIAIHIDKVLWSRTGAPAAPADFDTQLDGWDFHGDERTPVRLEGEPMMAVGDTVVMPITHLDQTATVDTAGWAPLSADSILPYDGSVLGGTGPDPGATASASPSTGPTSSGVAPHGTADDPVTSPTDDPTDDPTDGGTPPVTLAGQVAGGPLATLVNDLDTATPDPAASPTSSLPPDERFAAANAAEAGDDTGDQ